MFCGWSPFPLNEVSLGGARAVAQRAANWSFDVLRSLHLCTSSALCSTDWELLECKLVTAGGSGGNLAIRVHMTAGLPVILTVDWRSAGRKPTTTVWPFSQTKPNIMTRNVIAMRADTNNRLLSCNSIHLKHRSFFNCIHKRTVHSETGQRRDTELQKKKGALLRCVT